MQSVVRAGEAWGRAPRFATPGANESESGEEDAPLKEPVAAWFTPAELEEAEEADAVAEDTESHLPVELQLEEDDEASEEDVRPAGWFTELIHQPSEALLHEEEPEPTVFAWLDGAFSEASVLDGDDAGETGTTQPEKVALELPHFDADDEDAPLQTTERNAFFDPLTALALRPPVSRSVDLCFREVYSDAQPCSAVLALTERTLLAGDSLRWFTDGSSDKPAPTFELDARVTSLTRLGNHVVAGLSSGQLVAFEPGSSTLDVTLAGNWPRLPEAAHVTSVGNHVLAGTLGTGALQIDKLGVRRVLSSRHVIAFASGSPGLVALEQANEIVLSDGSEQLSSPFATIEVASSARLSVDQNVRALLLRGKGVWASEGLHAPGREYRSFAGAQALCAAVLSGRSVVWGAFAGENGETEIVELDLADGRETVVGRALLPSDDDVDPTIERMYWDGGRRLLWLCSEAGVRALRRFE